MTRNPSGGAVAESAELRPADKPTTDDASGGSERAEAYDRSRFPDNFYPGLIIFLDRFRGRGAIRSYSGREIRFEFPFVSIVGAPLGGRTPGLEWLREGDTVGFDVGWTSRGLRVTKIKPAARAGR